MLLAIDIGNTNTVVGVFEPHGKLRDYFRLASNRQLTLDEAGFLCEGLLARMQVTSSQITKVAICSVVPPLTPIFEGASAKFFKQQPLVVSHVTPLPIKIDIDHPEQLGADRIANAVAGQAKFSGAVIIVDFGTATTFDVVNGKGAYIGGVIIPGPETAMAELARKAARLFEVRLERPKTVIGRSTASAMKSGMYYGTIGQVDFIIDQIIKEAGFKSCTVVATGGLAEGVVGGSRHIKETIPTLTLEGLRLISSSSKS